MTIWKFPLGNGADQIIDMPEAAQILCVQMQGRMTNIWAIVDPEAPIESRRIYVRGTGHDMKGATVGTYIGTIQQQGGMFVWHIFDGGAEVFKEETV